MTPIPFLAVHPPLPEMRTGEYVVLLTALLLAARSPIRLPDLCEAVSGDRNASAPNTAVRRLRDAGLAEIGKSPTERGLIARWSGD